MKTKSLTRHLAWGLLGLVAQQVNSQVTIDNNNGLTNAFVGWNAGANQVLEVKNEANQPIEWWTGDIRRMLMNPSSSYTIGSFALQPKPGAVLLSPNVDQFFANTGPGPYSMIHLAAADNNAQQASYREWMDVGVTFTGNADHGYVGQKVAKETILDFTDMVIHWSDNPSKFLKDRMRFIFTSGFNANDDTGASSEEGLEGMRLFPVDNDNVNVGIGDWHAANVNSGGLITEPEERLDVVDGRVRIRALPEAAGEADGTFKVMVVDDTPSPNGERGVVKWVDPSVFTTPATSDCDWTIANDGSSGSGVVHHVYTAVGPSSDTCPDDNDHVGIGTDAPGMPGKLTVAEVSSKPSGVEYGLHVTMLGDATGNDVGVHVSAEPQTSTTSPRIIGMELFAKNGQQRTEGIRVDVEHSLVDASSADAFAARCTTATTAELDEAIGVQGRTEIDAACRNAFGLHGSAQNNSTDITQNMYGVFAKAEGRASKAFGVRAESYLLGADAPFVNERFGVFGTVTGGTTPFQCGVYGKAPAVYNAGNDLGSWAGYFQGIVRVSSNAYVNGNVLVTSDADLKTNVEEIPDALGLLNALAPKSYEFVPQDHPHLQMPQGRQWGLLAQELREVLPELVKEVPVPAEYDPSGVLVAPSTSHLAVNYIGLIPILIAAVQEQQGQIAEASATETELQDRLAAQEARADELAARLDQLEQALALCCTNPDRSESPLAPEGDLKLDPATERLLRIDPNPFTDRTTIRYTLERDGRTMLLVNSSDGKQLQVLQEAVQQAGEYQQEWHTDHLAPGIYYVTLLLDGEPLVKRAVKVR